MKGDERIEYAIAEIHRRIKAAEDQAAAEPDDLPGVFFKQIAKAEGTALTGALRLLQPVSPEDLERAAEYVRERGFSTQPNPPEDR